MAFRLHMVYLPLKLSSSHITYSKPNFNSCLAKFNVVDLHETDKSLSTLDYMSITSNNELNLLP